MDTAIGYLELVREDLLDAGQRRTGPRRRVPRGSRFRPRTLVAGLTAVTLVVAGGIGWFVLKDGRLTSFDAASTGGTTGATGATGATAGSARRDLALPGIADEGVDFAAVPPPMPATKAELDALHGAAFGLSSELSRVIRTAELALVIARGSFEDSFAQAVGIAEAHGGFVADSTTRERSGSLTIRVPAGDFDEALAELRKLGDVEVQTLQGRDVTADYVDLQARLRIANARRTVLLRLMDKATSIEQTIRVQNALDDTQLRIEELQGQTNLLDDRVALATIQLRLREEGVEPAEVETASIPNAFERAISGFVGVIAGIVIGLGYVIPVLVIVVVAWFVASRVRRRRAV